MSKLIDNLDKEEEIIYTGEVLKKAVYEAKEVRDPLIYSLIAKKSTNMFFAPDGVGKSTVILQCVLESSNGLDVFGGLKSKPMNTIILLTERPKEEAFERIKYMSPIIQLDWERIIIDDTVRGMDLMNATDYDEFLQRVLFLSKKFEKMGGTDHVVIDTLYGTTSEGLSSEKACGQVNKLLRRIQSSLGNANSYTHHTNRGQRNKRSGAREAEDMYGNRSLSANCTGIFHITKTDSGTLMEKKKDSLQCLGDKFELRFDAETYMSLLSIEQSTKFAFQKINAFINDHFKLKKDFTFDEILKESRVSVSYLRDQLSVQVKEGKIINCKPLGQKALYKVLRDY